MKIWLLSHLKDSPGNRLVEEAARRRSHETVLVDPQEIALSVASPPTQLSTVGDPAMDPPPDLVFTRMGSSAPWESLHVLRQLELMGLPCINASEALRVSRDKFSTFQVLSQNGLPVPATVLVGRGADPIPAVENLPGPPWIVKIPISTQGGGVVLAESARSLRSVCDAFHAVGQRVMVQAFVAQSAGTDVRVLTVGGRAISAMRRRGKKDEFRSNLHRGGEAEKIALTGPLRKTAEKAAAAVGLDVAGADILESDDGPMVVEVNSSPGLEGLSVATEKDVAEEVIRYLETRHRKEA
jgi:ribosomal protein S6--L-glutamate ligase